MSSTKSINPWKGTPAEDAYKDVQSGYPPGTSPTYVKKKTASSDMSVAQGSPQPELNPNPISSTKKTNQKTYVAPPSEQILVGLSKTGPSGEAAADIIHTQATGKPMPKPASTTKTVTSELKSSPSKPTYESIRHTLNKNEQTLRTQSIRYPVQTYVSEKLQGEPKTKQIQEIGKQKNALDRLEKQQYQIRRTTDGYEFYKTPKQIEQELLSAQKQRIRSHYEKPSFTGFLHTWSTGMLSWEDPLSLKSLYYTVKGQPEKIIETKARASMDLDAALEKGWPSYTLKAVTGPMATVGASYGIGAGVGAGVGAIKTTYPLAGKAVQTGLGAYGGVKGYQSVKQAIKQGEQGWLNLGSRLAVTLPSGILGYSKGAQYGASKTAGFMQSRGYKPITYGQVTMNKLNPQNLLVKYKAEFKDPNKEFAQSVLRGETTFSESKSAEASLKLFQKSRDPITKEFRTAHAAPHKWKGTGEISAGSSEHPGLYITPEGKASPYFLKVDVKNLTPPRYIKFGWLPKIKKPSLVKFNLRTVTRAPENIRYSMGRFNTWLQKQLPGSKAYISAKHEIGAPEIEAVIPAGARYSPHKTGYNLIQRIKGYRYYTKYQGRNIPIREFKILDITKGSKIINAARFGRSGRYDYLRSDISHRSYFSPYTTTIGASLVSISSNKYIPRSSNLRTIYSKLRTPSSKINSMLSSSYKSTSVTTYPSSKTPSKTTSYTTYTPTIKTPSITKNTRRYIPRTRRTSYAIPSIATYKSTYKPPVIPNPQKNKNYVTVKKTKIKTNLNKILPDYRYREFNIPDLTKIIGGNKRL